MRSEFAESMYSNIMISPEVLEIVNSTTLAERFALKFASASSDAIQLLMSLLKYAPHERIKPEDGMISAYCVQFHDEQEPGATAPQAIGKNPDDAERGFLFEDGRLTVDDNEKLKTQQYREMLHGICKAHANGARGPKTKVS